MARELSLAIVGAAHPNKRGPTRLFEMALCVPGEPIELRPEPKNPADEYAIAVFSCRGVQLGYIAAERAPYVGMLMKRGEGVRAVFQQATGLGGIIRATFDGSEPTLPARRPKAENRAVEADPDPDWYPDEEWPN